ncbi:MAG: YciI family protein [Pseudomonadota bacterium]
MAQQYILLFADEREESEYPDEEMQAWGAYFEAMGAAGILRGGEQLFPSFNATTVRIRDGVRQVQDGPFADTREKLGGFGIIEVEDLDTALDWAAKCPCALDGSVEVRPIVVMEDPSA